MPGRCFASVASGKEREECGLSTTEGIAVAHQSIRKKRVLIVGAGDAGEMIAREMIRRRDGEYIPVGFLDDDRMKLNNQILSQKLTTLESVIRQLNEKLNKSYIKDDKIISDYKNGLVQEIGKIAGDAIQPGVKILNLVNMDSLIVVADVSEDFIKDVKVGAAVDIFPLSDATKQYKGHVLKISDAGVEKNGETVIQTEISIDNPDEFTRPNFNVDVKIAK